MTKQFYNIAKIVSFITILLLTACSSGSEISFSTAKIDKAILAEDSDGNQETTVFDADQVFYLVVGLANAPDDTEVKAAWTAVEVNGADPDTFLDETVLKNGSGQLTFELANDTPWPAGSYKVDLYLNGELDRTLGFSVSGESAAVVEPVTKNEADEPDEPIKSLVASGAVQTLEEVKTAVIQIEAQGTFVDPEVGTQYNVAGRGSGFIIDESGLAVTNNHVVTGAALLKVWVGGESEPRNARVLGISECADLAIIDIDGEGYPYLDWYTEEVEVGLDVYAAGFPLGDPEYTLTRGIISKEKANGETSWASVDSVVQHDATINPGNSGGALVTTDGKLVAVNYAGAAQTNQYFAIGQDQALPVIEQLQAGNDFLSIGINGRAVNNGEGLSGIWVSSVKSGSPADTAGIKGGDILTRLEGLVLSVDGTMADYCDILRTHEPSDTLGIEVLRFATQEVLEGQLNGRELVQTQSFAQQVVEEAGVSTNENQTASYSSYVTVQDQSGRLQVEVPAEWSDTDGSPWMDGNQELGVAITAAPNMNDFFNGWGTPGVYVASSNQFDVNTTVDDVIDQIDHSSSCQYQGRKAYQNGDFSGKYDFWSNCDDSGNIVLTVVAEPADQSYMVLVLMQIVSDADLEAADHILSHFSVQH